ncbi:unnamed protein product, partial [Ascophyllum nodosum]
MHFHQRTPTPTKTPRGFILNPCFDRGDLLPALGRSSPGLPRQPHPGNPDMARYHGEQRKLPGGVPRK